MRKVPGVAETLDWAAALVGLEVRDLAAEPEVVQDTLLCLLKTQEDRLALAPEVTNMRWNAWTKSPAVTGLPSDQLASRRWKE